MLDLGKKYKSNVWNHGVENIIVAADVFHKEKLLKMNLQAWLKSPHLGMMAMLTAGDKHFFRYVEAIKKQTGIESQSLGVNPLEQTHFLKQGFRDKPDFEEDKVYTQWSYEATEIPQ